MTVPSLPRFVPSPLSLASLALLAPALRATDPCTASAFAARQSCKLAAAADLWASRAHCANLPSGPQRAQCNQAAWHAYLEARNECSDQHEARLELCDELGGGIYYPIIDPEDFVAVIDNPYMPLIPGTTFVYEKVTSEGVERLDYIVTNDTREILGVTCTVVHDIVSLNGELVEDTFDWFAQDEDGNVWYFGELTAEYENGFPVSTEGAWEAGVGDALPGIVMLGDPEVEAVYRQEFLVGEAEDAAEVESTSTPVTVPYGNFPNCLQTEDFSPLEPDHLEFKYYAPGVGLVLELNPESGERTELILVTHP